jgi:predicted transposase YbfD/YdcC
LLALLCLAWLSGIHGYRPAHEWAAALPPSERLALGFTRPGPPAASTLFEVLRLLSWEALETQLRRWVEAVQLSLADLPAPPPPSRKRRRKLPEVDPCGLAIDGKALRGSMKRGADLAGLLAVVTHRLALTVAQVPLATKEGELTGVRPLLRDLVLTGLVVTVDAQFTQPDLAETIGAQGGDYVMRVKANQPTLLLAVRRLLSPEHYERTRRRSTQTHELGHGRSETRHLVAHALTPAQQQDLDWPHAAQVFVVRSQRVRQGKPVGQPTLIYGVTSLPAAAAGPERLLRLYRGHWTVENRVFWERDVAFGEDRSPARAKNLVGVLACLRGAVLTLVRVHDAGHGITHQLRRFNANRASALEALGCV